MRPHRVSSAYAAKLKEDSWQIVIPTTTRTSPISFNASFQSKLEADAWMRSDEGQSLLSLAQITGQVPSVTSLIQTGDRNGTQ
jgi:hypothetical protein